MENIFVAVDAGKYNTKVKSYNTKTGKTCRTKFRTKISPGTFDDDMFEKGTFIVQPWENGPVYKIGRDGTQEPALETSKKSEIHKACTMAAIALACGPGSYEGINVVIGIPLQVCNIPKERLDYKKYILGEPGEQHVVRIKTSCTGPVHEVRLSFEKELVYPEGIGVLYEFPSRLKGPTGVIDIGNLNTNNLYCDSFLINTESCYTEEQGGKILISNLAATLTSELGARVNEDLVASTLLKPYEQRRLRSVRGDTAIEERSAEVIRQALMEHVTAIKQKCATRHWPLEFMNLVCMGGTAKLLVHEIHAVFGEHAFIPEDPEYVNVDGFLRKMCADFGIDIGASSKKDGDAA